MNKKEDSIAGNQHLPLKIKPKQTVHLGDLKNDFNSGCSVVDVSFPNVFYVEIGEIHVKNYYTAWLSVQAKFREQGIADTDVKWKTCVERFQMMPDSHTDGGAEDFFTLSKKHMQCDLNNIIALRFILRQPSPMWKEYRLDDIICFKTSVTAPADFSLPSWLAEANKRQIGQLKHQQRQYDLKGICSMDKLSSHLQQMWATADAIDSVAPTTSVGRYDIDGSYEINLLSYN